MHACVLAILAAGSFGAFASRDAETAPSPAPQVHGTAEEPQEPIHPLELTGLIVERLSKGEATPILADVSRTYPFIWPAVGPITSYMGSAHPTGIDIGLKEGVDAAVVATAAGVVTFAGGSDAENYGLRVEVDHGGGLKTLYAHLSAISVVPGQSVEQGGRIGLGGSTGKSDGKHLHFEVLDNGQRYDPLRLLPVQGQPAEKTTVDCSSSAIVINQGSQARFDFGATLGQSRFSDISLKAHGDRTATSAVWAELEDGKTVVINTQASLGGSEERFNLIASVAGTQAVLQCEVVLKPLSLTPAYYVRSLEPAIAAPTSTPAASIETAGLQATPTAAPSTTPTPSVPASPSVTASPAPSGTPTPAGSATPPATTTSVAPQSTATATPAMTATPGR